MFSARRTIEIEFGDCDPAGIVYYPNYFRFFDDATAHLLENALGMKKRDWIDRFGIVGIPMVDTGAKFIRASRFGDQVVIESTIAELGLSSFGVRHLLLREESLAVEAHEVRVWAGRDPTKPGGIRAVPLPDEVRKALGQE
jgi:4-hydroxybenzoyl-CoA thioesterase